MIVWVYSPCWVWKISTQYSWTGRIKASRITGRGGLLVHTQIDLMRRIRDMQRGWHLYVAVSIRITTLLTHIARPDSSQHHHQGSRCLGHRYVYLASKYFIIQRRRYRALYQHSSEHGVADLYSYNGLVGSLGIPALGFLPAPKHQEFSFFDTRVSDNVEHAFHALALDEHRKPFSPSIWEHPGPQSKLKVLKQVWFPGVHSNVGGSYDDTNLADISLAWMMEQLSPFLDFSSDYLEHINKQNNDFYKGQGKTPRHWVSETSFHPSWLSHATTLPYLYISIIRLDLRNRLPC